MDIIILRIFSNGLQIRDYEAIGYKHLETPYPKQ